MNLLSLPKKSILYALICGGALFAIIFLTFYSNYRTMEKQDLHIRNIKTQIEGQKKYAPLFQDLFKKIQFKKPGGLPFPEQAKLSEEDTGKISIVLQNLAEANDFMVKGIIPDVDSSIDGSKHLMISIIMVGEFLNFRNYLLQLVSIPQLEHIEQIQVQNVEESKEIRLKIWMAKE